MKITHTSTIKTTSSHSTWLRDGLRMIGAVVGWAILILQTLVTAFFSGWVLLAISRIGKLPVEELMTPWLMFVALTLGLGWLVSRFIASARIVGRVVGAIFALIFAAWLGWSLMYPDRALFLARDIAYESTVKDFEHFPERTISNAAPGFHFKQNLSPELFQTIEYRSEGESKQMGFEDFLQSTNTTSFIVIKDDTILYEDYFNGYNRDSIVTSFSVAKSFTSALIGIAMDEGYIGSVDDLMIEYIPELKGKGFDGLTIRHLLTMSSGIQYLKDDELPPLKEIFQFTDDGMSYAYPDRRSLILQVKPDGKPLASEFNYNNYNTILLGMILERTTGRSPSGYLQEKIWKPLGMEYPASWSLESEESGFELMVSGINARAIDFAKFGRLFLNNGNWNGKQIISSDWVLESTSPDLNDHRVWHSDVDWKEADGYYKYQWWGRLRPDGNYDYTALGKFGQFIFVAPQENMIIVRFGLDEGGVDDWADVFQGIIAKVPAKTVFAPPPNDWPVNTPEEQGFDSAKTADALLAIKNKGTQIHSLMILRNDKVILDAYFYPYDGSIYHDLASVTKSVTTTLIGIAIDQGKLHLDNTLLSFFPDREIANRDERKEQITVRHLLSMSSGLDCDTVDDELTLMAMRVHDDFVQYALDLPVVRDPGSRFVYCGVDMHLLSALLQQATGMSALEFAHEYLFGPLGIKDVYWPADPQGVTHGWGDLCLRPADMAKLGTLFMHQGEWNGQQLVSRKWVETALQPRWSGTGRVEDYGYGWWIGQPENEPEFLATGNGGQKIKVYPRLKMIIVLTGGGFEYDEIAPHLLRAMVDLENPLPANPAGVDRLQAALIEVSKRPASRPVPPLPVIASAISGKTFILESNRLGLMSLRLDFDNSAEASFQLEIAHEPGPRQMGVGLDGVYRPSRSGRPVYTRGHWADGQTFLIDYNEGPGLAAYMIRLKFEGDQIFIEIPGLWRGTGFMQ